MSLPYSFRAGDTAKSVEVNENFNYLQNRITTTASTLQASVNSVQSGLSTVSDKIANGATVAAGTIIWFGGASVPEGYLLCDGTAKSRTDYAALFNVIGTTYGGTPNLDPMFAYNVQQAQALGIDTGTYWYSYATTVEAAKQEAEVCYEVIKNYDFTYPVYLDIEDPCQMSLSTAEVSAIIETFCSYLQDKGYYVGLYSFTNFLSTKVYPEVLSKYDIWVANFNVEVPAYSSEYGIWQHCDSGLIDGIEGVVDLNHAYINYPSIVSPETYDPTHYPDITTEPEYPYQKVNTGIANGIDVSEWQGEIDWQKVKEDGIDYAIIRAGYGKFASQKDKMFDRNMAEAEKAGIGRGVYWYSYATTVEDVIKEAEACIEVIKDYKFEYPVYYDVEDPVIEKLSKQQVTALTAAFCSKLEEAGYYVGLTSYTRFINSKLEIPLLDRYAVWVAHYGVNKPAYGRNYGMWQFSSTSSVNGIKGNVDRDYLYYDYPTAIKQNHLNGYSENESQSE